MEELTAKLPIKGMTVEKVAVPMPLIATRPHGGAPATITTSPADYKAKTGVEFHPERAMTAQWVDALRKAGGQSRTTRFFYGLMFGVDAGEGQGEGFSAVGNGNNSTNALREMGQAFGLPGDLAEWSRYPYKGPFNFALEGPDHGRVPHTGPSWGFDLKKNTFISPKEHLGGDSWGWKAEPMQGNLHGHFSDFNARHMQSEIEGHYVVNSGGDYYCWGGKAYDTLVPPSIELPIEDHVAVYSVMYSISSATLEANFVYPAIGPYTSGLIRTFDPTIEADRADAESAEWCSEACDFTLKITQGGEVKLFMLNTRPTEKDPAKVSSFATGAVNVRASDGEVSSVELLATPSVNTKRLRQAEVLYPPATTLGPTTKDPTAAPIPTPFPTAAPTPFPTTFPTPSPTRRFSDLFMDSSSDP